MSSSVHPKEVVVREGDCLWTLGQKLNVDWTELQTLNHLKDDIIIAGEVLKVPQISRIAASPSSSDRPRASRYHAASKRLVWQKTKAVTVEPGDTAWDIAMRFGLTLEDLEEVNAEIPDIIYPGDVLFLPETAYKLHRAFRNLKTVKAKIKGVAPGANFFDVFPPEKDTNAYREKHRGLLDAMRLVETSFIMPAPVGDDGLSIGPLQISHDYHTDAWWLAKNPTLYEHCEDVDYSERTVINYWLRYCPWALEFDDQETLARIHNGGPRFWRHIKTASYWRKVRSAMRQFGYYKGIPELNPDLAAKRLSTNGMFPIVQRHLSLALPVIDPLGWDYHNVDFDAYSRPFSFSNSKTTK
eukprot:TRINITY_DN33185_c0_g1_i1.p1 TRINITY_DN33185_c0_g1~~TRINITY_DN33185_c0_g1_i1.p1  ORF type:complete len:355 (-),score=43.63 TRINITY_DN33185_c0_g1_i1:905-1969(-)